MRRLRKEIRSALRDDDRRMLADAKGGFLKLESLSDAATLSFASTPRAARLKDSEFRKSVPRALLCSSSREIIGLNCDTRTAVR